MIEWIAWTRSDQTISVAVDMRKRLMESFPGIEFYAAHHPGQNGYCVFACSEVEEIDKIKTQADLMY